MRREKCKTILQVNKSNPNGVVGEKIILALKLSDWYRGELTNRTSENWHKGEKVEKVLITALDKIEKLLIQFYKKLRAGGIFSVTIPVLFFNKTQDSGNLEY